MKAWFDPQDDIFFLEQWFPSQPPNTIEITPEVHEEMMVALKNGKYISHDNNGFPIAVSPAAKNLTPEELVIFAQNKKNYLLQEANEVIADWRTELMLGEINDADSKKLSIWMSYRRDVKAIDTSIASDINWPELPKV